MTDEPSLNEVYRKFGEVSEAAQLLETELGNLLLLHKGVGAGLLENENPEAASRILEQINRNTLGQVLWQLRGNYNDLDALESLLNVAKAERNRLFHSFYREHNFRRNSAGGRTLMLHDLEAMHEKIIDAYKAVMKLSGIDLDKVQMQDLPTKHVPI
jgi:hypothetical protein